MKIITLTGNAGTGKTTTLNALYKELNPIDSISGKRKLDIEDPSLNDNGDGDHKYFISWGGKRIAIVTGGDLAYQIVWNMGIYFGKGADVLIIANRRKQAPINIIESYGFPHRNIEKSIPEKTEQVEIIEKIKQYLEDLCQQ